MNKKIKIAVIGLGYVGLRLAIEFSKKYPTIGFEKDNNRFEELKNGFDKTLEVSPEELRNIKLTYAKDKKDITDCNVYIITVPTPVDKYNNPDMSPLNLASKIVGSILDKADVVIYESTVYPSATEEYCVPILESESGLKYNVDFFCGYSPERINPGDKDHTLTTITKVTSGSNEEIADFVDELYKSIISAGTFKASSIAIAEAAKVIENTQRDVNIALINELSILFNKLGLDTNEVLKAAGTKWNFLPFQPGLVGGHCIGVDPYYLTHKSKEVGYHPEIILAGRRINDRMGKYIADCIVSEMTKIGLNILVAKVAFFGITFKENCPDLRNTKVPDIITSLKAHGCEIMVSDPYADANELKNIYDIDLVNFDNISNCDVVVFAVAHEKYRLLKRRNLKQIFNNKGLLIDIKSIIRSELLSDLEIHHWKL